MNDNSFYKETVLYNATSTSFNNITLSDSMINYDMLIFTAHDTTYNDSDSSQCVGGQVYTKQDIIDCYNDDKSIWLVGYNDTWVEYTLTNYTTLTAVQHNTIFINRIIGINFGTSSISPIIYSTEEREIGVWKDNKPLYQKTFVGTTDNQQYFIPNTSYIETLVSVNGYMSESGWDYELPFHDGSDFISITNNETNGVRLYTSSYFVGLPFVATLQYTKKTDVPGSGQYNTLGVPTVHYSTDEQVIGTWIDGSTLYETTFHNVTVHNTGDTLIPTPSNWNVVKLDGYLGRSPDMEHIFLPFQASNISSSIYCRLYADYNVYGGILLESNIEGAATITARYTKTAS